MVLLPSEKARLVLGYLGEQQCTQAYKEFLITSPHLRELRGMIRRGIQPHEYELKMISLSELLDEYSSIECIVRAIQFSCSSLKDLQDCKSLLNKIQKLIEFVKECSKEIHSTNNSEHTSKSSPQTANNTSLKSHRGKYIRKRSKRYTQVTESKANHHEINLTNPHGIPIIEDIPESHYSDESTDICSIGAITPFKRNITHIDIDKYKAKVDPPKSLSPSDLGLVQNSQTYGEDEDTALRKNPELESTRKQNDLKFNSIEDATDGLNFSAVSEAFLERTDIHEKIAENINKMFLATVNNSNDDKKIKKDDNTRARDTSTVKTTDNCELTDLDLHLNNVIRDIVNVTEKDHIFNEILDDLVCKVAQDVTPSCSSDDTVQSRPTTSTPEHAQTVDKVLNTSTSPVHNCSMKEDNCSFSGQGTRDSLSNKSLNTIQEDSIKHRLRNNTKLITDPSDSKNSSANATEGPSQSSTPQKKSLDLLALAISNADVSGSMRKSNSFDKSQNDNKIVILSNELVSRNISDYTNLENINVVGGSRKDNIGESMENKDNALPVNTHYILPSISSTGGVTNNNVFTQMPQYLISNTDTDQNRLILIGGTPLNIPPQNNVINSDNKDVMTVPTFIMLPPTATDTVPQVLNDNTNIGYQSKKVSCKPKAVILPQTERKKSQRKILPNIRNYTELCVISESNETQNSVSNIIHVPSKSSETVRNSPVVDDRIHQNIKQNLSTLDDDSVHQKLKQNLPSLDNSNENIIKNIVCGDSSAKTIENVERDTPEFPINQNHKRQSLSTPRRRKSHVRVLDFNTPPKSSCTRKATTSPKLGSVRPTPKTTEKIFKNTKSATCKEPIRSVLFRSPKKKIIYLPDDLTKYESNSGKSSIATRSPFPKLKGGWDEVQGLSLIVGESDSKTVDRLHSTKQTEIVQNTLNETGNKVNSIDNNKSLEDKSNIHPSISEQMKNEISTKQLEVRIIRHSENSAHSDTTNDTIKSISTTKSRIRINSRRGEKFDFQPTLSKHKNNKSKSFESKNRWDSNLRSLAVTTKPLKAPQRRSLRKKNDPKIKTKGELNKSDLSNNSVENMEEHAKKLEDALNMSSINNTSNNSRTKSPLDHKRSLSSPQIESNDSEKNQKGDKSSNKVNMDNAKSSVDKNVKNKENITFPQKKQGVGIHKKCNTNTKIQEKNIVTENVLIKTLPVLNDESTMNHLKSKKSVGTSRNSMNLNENKIINTEIKDEKLTPIDDQNLIEDKPKIIEVKSIDETSEVIKEPIINTAAHNITDSLLLLETPFKCDGSMVPKTPRFICPNIVEDTPSVKIPRIDNNSLAKCGIPTPNFPITPKITSTSTPEVKSDHELCASNTKLTTDNSGSSSYYKPDESENICLHRDDAFDKFEKDLNEIKNENLIKVNKEDKSIEETSSKTHMDNCHNEDNETSSSDSSSSSSDSSDTSSSSSSSSSDSSLSENDTMIASNKKLDIPSTVIEKSIDKVEEIKPVNVSQNINKADTSTKKTPLKNRSKENLALELVEKRNRILSKVRADLKLSVVNTKKGMKNSVLNKKRIDYSKKVVCNSKITKPNVTSVQNKRGCAEDKISNKVVSEKIGVPIIAKNIKNRRKSDSPRKRHVPVEIAPGVEIINTIKPSHDGAKIDLNLRKEINICENDPGIMTIIHNTVCNSVDNQYPILHISEDESDVSINHGVDNEKPVESNFKQTIEKSESGCTKEDKNTENNILKDSGIKSFVNIENSNLEAKLDTSTLPQTEFETETQPKNSHLDKCSGENLNVSKHEEICIEIADNISDTDSYEFTLEEQEHIEYCTENEIIRTNLNANDGFDVNTFKINICAEGVLTISPFNSLLDIAPTSSSENPSSKIKDLAKNNKATKTKRSPLNILFDEIDESVEPVESEVDRNISPVMNSTPCANLYENSPRSKYQKSTARVKKPKSDIGKHTAEENTEKAKTAKTNIEISDGNKSDSEMKIATDRSKDAIENTSQEEQSRKRKRENDTTSIIDKKAKSCDPHNLLKNVNLDFFLNKIHGPK